VGVIDIIKSFINWISQPYYFVTLSIVIVFCALRFKGWTKARNFLIIYAGFATVFFLSCLDPNFRIIVVKADNLPIAGMLFLIIFFVWLALKQAFDNDERLKAGKGPVEAEESKDKLLCWPHLVYTEFICLILLTVVLLVWSIVVQAPIEQPANLTDSPNPSKAPWYFLGLQEMLVYYDPWIAGVLLPGYIILGLMAIPYIDTNPKGNGYYTFAERKWEISAFLFGFIVLWIMLIILGTFLRGPNWNFFGPFDYWDIHKVEPLVNIHLSDIIWVKLLRVGLPKNMLVREMFGIILVILYLFGLPMLLKRFGAGRFYAKMGAVRYYVMMNLFLLMMSLPIKMYLRWAFNFKYVVNLPEIFFNI
jgi:cytochrome b/b6/petD-like protein